MTSADARARGRDRFDRRAWADAFAQLSAADREAPLEPEDLERLAMAAYLLGRDEDSADALGACASGAPAPGRCARAPRAARSGWPSAC